MADNSAAVLARPALNPAEQWWNDVASAADRGTSALLETETAGGRFQRSVYELFSEMEEKDAQLWFVKGP